MSRYGNATFDNLYEEVSRAYEESELSFPQFMKRVLELLGDFAEEVEFNESDDPAITRIKETKPPLLIVEKKRTPKKDEDDRFGPMGGMTIGHMFPGIL